MSRVITLLTVFTVFAFALMLIGFLTPAWQSESEENTDNQGRTTETLTTVGLRDFHYFQTRSAADGSFVSSDEYSGPLTVGDLTHIYKTPNSEKTETITPPASEQVYKIIGSVLSDSVDARDGVTGTGITAVLFALVFLLCFALGHKRKGPALCRHIGVIFMILTILLVFVGVFLYSEVLNVGACLVVWTGFCIFAALTGFFAGNVGGSGRGRWMPIGLWLMAFILAGVALGVPRWMSQTRETLQSGGGIFPDYTSRSFQYAGVNGYGYENTLLDKNGEKYSSDTFTSTFRGDEFTTVIMSNGNTVATTYTKCDDTGKPCGKATLEEQTTFAPFKKGADEVLGCGIPAILFLIATGVGLFILSRGGSKVTKVVTAVCAFASSGFGFLGLFLYSAQTSVGYSFILYAAAGFCWVLVLVLAIFTLDPSVSEERGGLLWK